MALSDGLADRITVPLGVFGLRIDPVSAGDSGDYLCLVNNRRRPDAVVRLLVQGRPTPTPWQAESRIPRKRATKVLLSGMAIHATAAKKALDGLHGRRKLWADHS